mgnify:CR=1 FL=1
MKPPYYRILLLGSPGVGKGTIGRLLAQRLNISHFVMGDIIREHVQHEKRFGKLAAHYINSGNIVPNKRVVKQFFIITKRNKKYSRGIVLDGFPRNLQQASLLEKKGWHPCIVIYLSATTRTLIKRLGYRRICPKCKRVYNLRTKQPHHDMRCDDDNTPLILRSDDKPDVIKHRLDIYNKNTKPLIDYYQSRKILIRASTEHTPTQVLASILPKLTKQLMQKNCSITTWRKNK